MQGEINKHGIRVFFKKKTQKNTKTTYPENMDLRRTRIKASLKVMLILSKGWEKTNVLDMGVTGS